MGTCEIARARLLDSVRGSLAAVESLALDAHVRACSSCSTELAALRRAWDALDALEGDAPGRLRARVLSGVARAREAEARRAFWGAGLKGLGAGALAALASVAIAIARDPGCRSAWAIACCGTLWTALYAVAFAVLVASRRRSPGRIQVTRGLLAAGAGVVLTSVCTPEAGAMTVLAPFSGLAASAASSAWSAFVLGLVLAAVPLALALLLVRAGKPALKWQMVMAGTYFALLAPALYLGSSFMALAGVLSLVGGAALGALAPALLELTLNAPRAREA